MKFRKHKTAINKYLMQGKYLSGAAYFEEFATIEERKEALKEIIAAYNEFCKEPMKARASSVVNPHGLIVGHELVIN